MENKAVLIADDDASMLWVLERFFDDKGIKSIKASDGIEAARLLDPEKVRLALLDINMPGKTGLEVLKEAAGRERAVPVIIMTAESTMERTIEAMKLGAFDYISKPFDLGELEIIVERAFEDMAMRRKVSRLSRRLEERLGEETVFIGKSRAVQNVFKTIGRVAARDVDVLLLGESGTGKELVARVLHANSLRKEGPFVAVNSAAVPKELMESELFGHEKGAFTGAIERRAGKFELADGGTLFLDEVGDMSPGVQARLLRAVQEREFFRVGGHAPVRVDIRIITATNHDLDADVRNKRFREDLFFRISGVSITLPPLRKRKADIELLAGHFLRRFCREFGLEEKTLSGDAVEELKGYRWPGNVRELENVLRRAVLLSSSPVITALDLALPSGRSGGRSIEDIIAARLRPIVERTGSGGKQELYDLIMPFMERPLITLVLEKTGGNQVRAAGVLGLNRNTLRKKIKDLKINLDRFRR